MLAGGQRLVQKPEVILTRRSLRLGEEGCVPRGLRTQSEAPPRENETAARFPIERSPEREKYPGMPCMKPKLPPGVPSTQPRLRKWLCAGLAVLLWLAPVPTSAGEPTTDVIPNSEGQLRVIPIQHATLALEWNGKTLLVDPVGGAERFADLSDPDLIILTDIHGDHLNVDTLKEVIKEKTAFVAPLAVAQKLPVGLRKHLTALGYGGRATKAGVAVEVVPAYNITPEREKFHARGRGNGYLLSLAGQRVYISGDTEDIPEMRALKNIDVAFVCMNLPYTMTVDQAADAVRAFRPRIVYPYHCRGSDLEAFQAKVGSDLGIEVRIRDWYRP